MGGVHIIDVSMDRYAIRMSVGIPDRPRNHSAMEFLAEDAVRDFIMMVFRYSGDSDKYMETLHYRFLDWKINQGQGIIPNYYVVAKLSYSAYGL
jgi:hypothetical protein